MINEPNVKTREELINLFEQKKYSELIKNILELKREFPRSIFLLSLSGNIYNNLRNYEKSIKSFKEIIEIDKNNSDAYYNLGIIYKTIKEFDNSIFNYNKCIEINPYKFEAYNNLGNIYRDKNKTKLAIDKYIQCLEINPNYTIALQNFGVCLQNFRFSKSSKVIDRNILNVLKKNNILRPFDIIQNLIEYLYLNPKILSITNNLEILNKKYSLDELINEILSLKILVLLLKITPITDLKLEKVIKYLRKNILLNIKSIKDKEKAVELMSAIASQCFINEYIYSYENVELNALTKIKKKIYSNFDQKLHSDNSLLITCLAAYKSLNLYKFPIKILDIECISDLIKQQISEPKKEQQLKKELLSKKIENFISLKVKNQYENNPYPRWNKTALTNNPKIPNDFFKSLELNFINKSIKNWQNIEVLVAGCGTGQHAITTATKYANSFITAIDLSLNSLSYAKRKANELGIQNIDFIQMDILDLENYGKKFHIIESIGVLHHMEDPYEGWMKLYDVLINNGLMMIGLYSKIARNHIHRIRKDIADLDLKINNENIKKFRDRIIDSSKNDYKLITQSTDFYSLSSLRDLIFHVQEHNFTITEIYNFLKKLNLKFCGFENRQLLNYFKKTNNKVSDLYDLAIWNEFEMKYPRIFAGMYQFWCQKR